MSVYVSTWCWQHAKASGVDLLTLLAIADQANDEGEDAWPCYATLASRIRKSEKTVQRSILRLVDLGELTVEHRGGPSSRGKTHQRPNRYSFPAYRAWKTRQSDQSSGAPDDPKGGQSDQSSDSKGGQNQQRVDTAMTCDPSFDPSVGSDAYASDSDAGAPCPGPQCSTSEGGQEQGAGQDHGPDLFASWQGFNPEHPESQDQGRARPDVVAQNGNRAHGDSGVKVTRTKRSSSRAPLPPEQSANVGRSTGRWVDAYRDAHAGVEPSAQRRAQAGREIRALIVAGNDPERVLCAAESAGRAGFATVEQQLVRMTSTNGGSRPGRVSATELPRDDWRRFVQE